MRLFHVAEAAGGGFGSGGFDFGPGSGGLEFRLANGIPELRKITGDLGLLCNFLLLQGPICKMRIVLFISLIYPPLRKKNLLASTSELRIGSQAYSSM